MAMLVLVPGGSWYYLQSGYKRFQKSMGELKDYGSIPTFNLVDHKGKQIRSSDLQDKLSVFAFVKEGDEKVPDLMKDIALMSKQFEERKDALFILPVFSNSDDIEDVKSFADKYGLGEEAQCHFLTGPADAISKLAGEGFKVPDLGSKKSKEDSYQLGSKNGVQDYPYLVLIDAKGKIRNYYDAYDKASINRLVEQIALILPRTVEEDLELKREAEK